MLLEAAGEGPEREPARRGATAAVTDEAGHLDTRTGPSERVDPRVLARAQAIASRLALPRPRPEHRHRHGQLASAPYRGDGDDVDLDATLEAMTGKRHLDATDVMVRRPRGTRRSVALLIDCSGSMKGERFLTAAATVGALARELSHDDLAVIAFWSDAAVLARADDDIDSLALLNTLAAVPGRGLTNIAFPLQTALAELQRSRGARPRALLLSDCVHNAGPDPRRFAAQLPRLDVLFDTSGEKDEVLARDLARAGRGYLMPVGDYRMVAPAVSRIFAR